MRAILAAAVGLLAVVATLLTPLGAASAPGTHSAGSSPTAPAPMLAVGPARAPGAASPVAPTSSAPTSNLCPTPQNLPNWAGSSFWQDALVTFTVPGRTNQSGANFETVPCTNFLPEYLSGFYMNITTNVPLTQAYLTVWGTDYPTPTNPLPPLTGFDPSMPKMIPMFLNSSTPDVASFYFDTYRFFYPGTTIYFNVTLDSSNATPSTVNSAADGTTSVLPRGTLDNATWQFQLLTPWWSNHFVDDVRVFSNPPVLGGLPFDPNRNQTFSVGLESVGTTGAPGGPIPHATLTFTLAGQIAGTYGGTFLPFNHTWQNLSIALGPYPGETVTFNITAYLPWEGGAIDTIVSPTYSFAWSPRGGWWSPSLGLEANANITSSPSVLSPTPTTLPTGTPVNVSILEPLPNVTISSSLVRFHYSDPSGSVSGTTQMTQLSQNRSFVVLPGLPPGGQLTFQLLAKDVFNNPLASGNYTYTESGNSAYTPPSFSSFFFVEAIDASTGALVPGASYTISNATWSDSAHTTPLGFGALQIPNGAGFLAIPLGTYTLTVHALGYTEATTVKLTQAQPIVVHFWFPGGPIPGTATVTQVPITVGLVVGLVAATVALIPLFSWFKERQARAEEERRRVTL